MTDDEENAYFVIGELDPFFLNRMKMAESCLMVKSKNDKLQRFAIAGANRQYVWAKTFLNENNQSTIIMMKQ